MRSENRGSDRRFRLGRAFLLGALALLSACVAPGRGVDTRPSTPEEAAAGGIPVQPEILRFYLKQLRHYIDTLLILNSKDPSDWETARNKLRVLSPFHVFDEDPQLIHDFLKGSDDARRELGRPA